MFRKTETAIVTQEEWDRIHCSISEKIIKEMLKKVKEINKKFKKITSEEAIKLLTRA